MATFSKKVAYDLWNLNVKGPEPYEFHPPLRHLDEEGKRAYLRGFFSRDGNISLSRATTTGFAYIQSARTV